MSSVQRVIAQPKTRSFVVTQSGGDERGPYIITQAAVDAWLSSESSNLTVVGDLVTVTGNFGDVMDNLSPGGTPSYDSRKSLLDLGKEIVIGTQQESRLIVLRRVRAPGASNGSNFDGAFYVVTENYSTDTPSNAGRFTVRVARV